MDCEMIIFVISMVVNPKNTNRSIAGGIDTRDDDDAMVSLASPNPQVPG